MDGTQFQIDIAAQMTGADVATSQLRELGDKLTGMGATAASFDAAIDQVRASLAAAGDASAAAAAALAEGESKYNALAAASRRAGEALEKARVAGKDTGDLSAKAEAAAAAVRAEASALDELRAKSRAADAEQSKLSGTLKNLEAAAKKAGSGVKEKSANIEEMTALTKGALGPMGGVFEKATLISKGIGSGGTAGAVIAAAAAFAVLTSAVVTGYFALARFAVTSNKVAMERLAKASKGASENLGKLFAGVHVDRFVGSYEQVLGLLDESSSTARGLKTILEAMLNPVFDSAPALVPILRELFRGMVYGALQGAIAAVKLRNALRGVLPEGLASEVDWLQTAFWTGVVAAGALAASLAALAAVGIAIAVVLGISAAFILAMFLVPIVVITAAVALFAVVTVAAFALVAAAVVLSMALVLAPFLLVGAAIYFAITRFHAIKSAVLDFAASASDAAGSLISGLVGGITSGAGAVYDAVRGLAAGAIGALKGALGIHSPSTVFALQGSYTAEGFVRGIEGEQGSVDSAIESMVEPPEPSVPEAGSVRSNSSSGATYNITINTSDRSIVSELEAMLTRLHGGDLIQVGAG